MGIFGQDRGQDELAQVDWRIVEPTQRLKKALRCACQLLVREPIDEFAPSCHPSCGHYQAKRKADGQNDAHQTGIYDGSDVIPIWELLHEFGPREY